MYNDLTVGSSPKYSNNKTFFDHHTFKKVRKIGIITQINKFNKEDDLIECYLLNDFGEIVCINKYKDGKCIKKVF